MTDQVAASNTIAASEKNSWTIDVTIGQLNSASDYASCLEYVQNLSLVTAIEVLGADPGQVNFRLQLNASPEYLSEAVERGNILLATRAGNEYDYEFIQ